MFYLVETVLAPLFVWIIFMERPTTNTLIGGFIIIGAISFHSYMRVKKGRIRNKIVRV